MFKKKKQEPKVNVRDLVKRSSYSKEWLNDYNRLRKKETFVEGVIVTNVANGTSKVLFSLAELPVGEKYETEFGTPLERDSESNVLIGDHSIPSRFNVEWLKVDPIDSEVKPIRRRIARIEKQLHEDLSENWDELITTTFIQKDDKRKSLVLNKLKRINAECCREHQAIEKALERLEQGTDVTQAVNDADAAQALDRANAAIQVRADLTSARRLLRTTFRSFHDRLQTFIQRQIKIDNPTVSEEELDRQTKLVEKELDFGDNSLIATLAVLSSDDAVSNTGKKTARAAKPNTAAPRAPASPASPAPATPASTPTRSSSATTNTTNTTNTTTTTTPTSRSDSRRKKSKSSFSNSKRKQTKSSRKSKK